MNTALKLLAVAIAIVMVAVLSVWIAGLSQPSRRIHTHDTVIFVALRQDIPAGNAAAQFTPADALWKSQTLFNFVGKGDAYWTDFFILPPGTGIESELHNHPGISDMFVAEVELTPVPVFAVGMLRMQHLLGLTRRPTGPLPTKGDDIEGRREFLPTMESVAQSQELAPETQVTMVNFLEYNALAKGDGKDGRAYYLRYGTQAFRAVHGVGGQFLFAGRIKAVLVPPRSAQWQTQWDDLAAMIYPDPTAIFAMDQKPYYRKARGYRDEGLKRTEVIATRSH